MHVHSTRPPPPLSRVVQPQSREPTPLKIYCRRIHAVNDARAIVQPHPASFRSRAKTCHVGCNAPSTCTRGATHTACDSCLADSSLTSATADTSLVFYSAPLQCCTFAWFKLIPRRRDARLTRALRRLPCYLSSALYRMTSTIFDQRSLCTRHSETPSSVDYWRNVVARFRLPLAGITTM